VYVVIYEMHTEQSIFDVCLLSGSYRMEEMEMEMLTLSSSESQKLSSEKKSSTKYAGIATRKRQKTSVRNKQVSLFWMSLFLVVSFSCTFCVKMKLSI